MPENFLLAKRIVLDIADPRGRGMQINKIKLCLPFLLATSTALAQVPTAENPATAVNQTSLTTTCCAIPALTVVSIEILSTVNSQANKIGEKFAIRLKEPISVDGQIIVPAGATGSGDVVHAAKSRFGGKPGELIIAVRYLEHQGQRIPLRSLKFGTGTGSGKDNGGTAQAIGIAGGAVGGLVSMFITGGEVNVPAGTIAQAKTSADVIITQPESKGTPTQ
jgi:hypothetical protein